MGLHSLTCSTTLTGRVVGAVAAMALACAALALPTPTVIAASPEPTSNPDITLSAEPMLAGNYAGGSWVAFRVEVSNDGPAVNGELRIARTTTGGSSYARPVALATGARQEHILYAELAVVGNRFNVALISGGATLASVSVAVTTRATNALGVFVVAERPEALVGPLAEALGRVTTPASRIAAVTPEQLPPRVEPWASVDLLVWQDVESSRLTADRLAALTTWIALGGHLVIVAGSAGSSSFSGFPDELLPYRPARTVDVPLADLQAALGTLPPGAAPLPALTGELARGSALARSGDAVIAARSGYGQGTVTVVGFDPSTPWLVETAEGGANAFWSNAFAATAGALGRVMQPSDEGFISDALGNIPAVQVLPINLLALLLLAYVLAIGPLNYVVLRRRDRREWAWLTMPITILAFAVVAYLFGVFLKGGDTVINQLAVVHGATGAERGLAQVYVGVYSPSRAEFNVRVAGDVLLSAPAASSDFGPGASSPEQRPLDVLQGDPAILRQYGVGFGAQRAFRGQALTATPRVEADLLLVDNRLQGTLTNASAMPLDDVSLIYGDAYTAPADMAPGEVRTIDLATDSGDSFGRPLWEQLYPTSGGEDQDALRAIAARRALVHHLMGGWQADGKAGQGVAFGTGPIVLAWQSAPTLDVDLGVAAGQSGERVYVLRTRPTLRGPVVFGGSLIQHATVAIDGTEAGGSGGIFFIQRGVISVDYWPLGFEGTFSAARLHVRLSEGQPGGVNATGDMLQPLPPEEQPDADHPLASNPHDEGLSRLPSLQLFDRQAGTWIEFEPLAPSRTYEIAEPNRYVDSAGVIRARFVSRSLTEYTEFAFALRLEGTIE